MPAVPTATSKQSPAVLNTVRETPVAGLELHDAAKRVHRSEAAYAAVLASIRKHGIQSPLVLAADGKVLDGEFRRRAAIALGLTHVPTVSENLTDAAAVRWVYESKASREHLGEGERALLAVAYKKHLSEFYRQERAVVAARGRGGPNKVQSETVDKAEAIAKPKAKKDSRKETGEKFNVSTRLLSNAEKLTDEHPDLVKRFYAGEIGFDEAVKTVSKNAEIERKNKAIEAIQDAAQQTIVSTDIENNIHVGDAVAVMKQIANAVASLIMYSPPYHGVPIDYSPALPRQSYAEYLAYQDQVLSEAFRIAKSGGRLAIIIDTVRCYDKGGHAMLPIVHDIQGLAMKQGWKFMNDLAWIKDEVSGSKSTFGSFGLCSALYIRRNHETILLFFKDQIALDGDKNLCDFSRDEHKLWGMSEWRIKPEVDKAIRTVHPAPLPVEIAKRLVRMFTYGKDLVVDPFNGSGTTTATAKALGRRYIGIDQSELYCEFARQRTVTFAKSVEQIAKGSDSSCHDVPRPPVSEAMPS